MEVSSVNGEREHELNKSVSLSPISNISLDEPCDIFDCPLCGKCFTEKIIFESHLFEFHNLPKFCDCNGSLDCTMKQCDSETFICSICEKSFEELGCFKKHDHDHESDICFDCIDCVVKGRWKDPLL